MRILIDTNLFIPLEKPVPELDSGLATLVRLASEFGHQLILHPASIEDIQRDPNPKRKAVNLAKIAKYQLLANPPQPTAADLATLGLSDSNENNRVDNRILYAIHRDAANILITEDVRIHKKASRLGYAARVYYTQQIVEVLLRVHGRTPVTLPAIEELPLHSIDVENTFFESLRGRYDFNNWFRNAARSGRKAWVHHIGGQIGAICVYKEEENEVVTDDGKRLTGRSLKLCTFKVGENVRGRKIGELLLKAAFRYATLNGIENIYLTMGSNQTHLQALCEDFGFGLFGQFKGDEVFVKRHPVVPPNEELNHLVYHVRYFPKFRSRGVHKYVVPIKPGYHEILFFDHPANQQQLGLFSAGNAIKLAYLCHSRIQGIGPGDILLFYRSHDVKAVTSIGIVEHAADLNDLDAILQLVSKRTVFPISELREMAKKMTKVLLFRLAAHLDAPIPRDEMAGAGIEGNIQTIRRVSDEFFTWFIERAKLSNSLSPN